jgi:hypothetical protein
MSETDNRSKIKSIAAVVLFVFAIFGFLDSLFAISNALTDDRARLEARVYASRPMIPHLFYSELTDSGSENGRELLAEIDDRCEKTGGGAASNDPKSKIEDTCLKVSGLILIAERLESAYLMNGAVFDVVLENKGSTTAKGIQIPSGQVEFIDVFYRGSRLEAEYDSQKKIFKIPDLNPGENVRLEIWQSGRAYVDGDYYDFEAPSITFDGPKVNTVMHQYVRSDRWEYAEFFFDAGPIFGTILFVAMGFGIGCVFIVLLATVVGLAKGQTLREIFATPELGASEGR